MPYAVCKAPGAAIIEGWYHLIIASIAHKRRLLSSAEHLAVVRPILLLFWFLRLRPRHSHIVAAGIVGSITFRIQ